MIRFLVLLLTIVFLVGCQSTKIQTLHHFERIEVPSTLYTCQELLRSELPPAPIKNSDVHTLIERMVSKNGTCRANIKALEKIITEYNEKVDELNRRK